MKTQITARCLSLLAITAAWCVGLVILISPAAQAQNIYASNSSTNTIAEITTNGMLSVFAIGVNGPEGLAFDSKGDLFEADQGSGNIYEFTNNAGTLSSNLFTFASGLTGCYALAFNGAGSLFVTEVSSGSIYEFTNNAGTLSTNPVTFVFEQLSAPLSMAFDSNGDLFVGQNNGYIYEFTNSAGTLSSNYVTFAYVHINLGGAKGQVNSPVNGLAFDRFGNLFAASVTDLENGDGYILEFTNGVAAKQGGFASGLSQPTGLAFDSAGNLFVANPGQGASLNEIYEFTNSLATNGGVFASGLDNPQYIAIAPILAPSPTLTNIVVSPVSPVIAAGSNLQFSATEYFSDGSSLVVTNGGTNSLWSSGNSAVASITTNGLATGLTNGVTTITATSGSVSGNATLTVVSRPDISIQPTNTTVAPDGSVTFNVSAAGGDLSYQWQFDGTNINGATGASLTITNVNAVAIGVYSVIVSNAAGSVTSTNAWLASVGIAMFAGVIVDGPLGSNYLIQSASSANSTNWTTLTNVALPTQPYIYIDYTSPTNPLQFYRAVPQ